MILRCRTDERNSSNVNLLYGFRDRRIDLRNGIFEGIEVANDVVDLVNILFGEIFLVRGKVAGKNTYLYIQYADCEPCKYSIDSHTCMDCWM